MRFPLSKSLLSRACQSQRSLRDKFVGPGTARQIMKGVIYANKESRSEQQGGDDSIVEAIVLCLSWS